MAALPPDRLQHIHIMTDFDGTITDQDTLEVLLGRFGTPEWIDIEKQLEQGILTVDEAFQRQMSLLHVSLTDALDVLKELISVDDTLHQCAQDILSAGGRFSIISAGFHEIITYLLAGKIPKGVLIQANHVRVNDRHWTVIPSPTPKLRGLCTHCKRYWVETAKEQGDYVIYVGDGYTDRCPAEAADRVYAKGSLLAYRLQMGLPTHEFRGFGALWQDISRNFQGKSS